MVEAEPIGTYRAYEDWKPSAKTRVLLDKANAVLNHYEGLGRMMTVRQLHYQMLGPDYPNEQASYDKLKTILNKGRLAGFVSWTALEDRGRYLRGLETHESPLAAMKSLHDGYKRKLWADQDWVCEGWIEKDAGLGVLGSICNELRVDYFACRGYNSQSEMWKASRRFASYLSRGQRPVVLHIGDHDPSGLDMTRVIRERLEQFTGVPILVQRIALNMPQVDELKLPPNPVKVKDDGELADSRGESYVARYGDKSWELDALPPEYLQQVISDAVSTFRDPVKWDNSVSRELSEQEYLQNVIDTMGGEPSKTETEE